MLPLANLRRAVKNALAFASAQPGVEEVEVFASAGANLTVRLNYTSHIPSNGVEEPKSTEGYGLGIRAAFRTPDGIKTGFGSEPTDLSVEGAARALDKARSGASPTRSSCRSPNWIHPCTALSRGMGQHQIPRQVITKQAAKARPITTRP